MSVLFPSSGTAASAPPAAAATADQLLSFDITDADFETTLVQRSMDVPVLLDCWAPWCGPCRQLKPLLEKLVQAYEGRFVLAKLNTDENPQLAGMLGLRSIPHVLLFKGGQPVDQFTGALPESRIRAFLDPHVGAPSPSAQLLKAAAEETDHARAVEMLTEAQALDPQEPAITKALEERQAALKAQQDFEANRPAGDPTALRARIDTNPKDHQARFDLAAILAHGGDFASAFEQLLEVVLRDKAEHREAARVRMVEWFGLCPDPAVTDRAQRRLAMYLN
ncbi:MAG: tetratricopeptide repeat protein [Burkholderiaceae bacterium]|nr:tetratricopeptide repeat protein [Rhodoferax sp.]MCP5285279.1 tetratricopeptide repeat protein [Burkholderiaceae bacterium]